MKVIRKIITPISDNLIIKLPQDFRNKKIEVIILPYNEEQDRIEKKERLIRIFNESKGVLPEGYKFNREEAHER